MTLLDLHFIAATCRSGHDLPKCADRKAAMLPGILEAIVANPPHIMNIISDFTTSYRFTVTFNDDLALT